MQIKLFTIPVGDTGAALPEMNAFLRNNKILETENQFVQHAQGASWCFCIRYIEKANGQPPEKRKKTDYRHVLDEQTFTRFARLREIRKRVAADEGLSAYLIFTDAELAELAGLEELTPQKMLKIKGIGEKKVERFAHHFIPQNETHETGRKPD